jgi:large subunit ribosomal protein L17
MTKNMLRSLFIHERIKTTITKAKHVRRYAERLISFAQDKSQASNRIIFQYLQDRNLVKHLVNEIAPRFHNHNGGYTKVLRLGHRPGDCAEMALLELTVKKHKETTKKEPEKK